MNIEYRKAASSDAQTLTDYRIRFAIELNGPQSPEVIERLRNQMHNYFSIATDNLSCISYIAYCDNKVAGIGSIHFHTMPGNFKNPSGKWGYVMNMYTVPEFRKHGICSTILNLLVDEGIRNGVTAFELHATKEGLPVYEKGGFYIHSEPTLRKFVNL
jgi:predicted acetyltransferase